MSEQFEKIVLEKLDNLEKSQGEQQQFNRNVLEKLDNLEKNQEKQQQFNKDFLEKLNNLEKGQEKLEAGQQRLEERQEKLEARQERLEEKQEKLEARQENFEMTQQEFNMRILELYENLKTEVSDTKFELTKFSNHFTAFEFEINRKVDLLLETYDFDYKQLAKNNADIFNLQEKYSNHDCRITSLELRVAMP